MQAIKATAKNNPPSIHAKRQPENELSRFQAAFNRLQSLYAFQRLLFRLIRRLHLALAFSGLAQHQTIIHTQKGSLETSEASFSEAKTTFQLCFQAAFNRLQSLRAFQRFLFRLIRRLHFTLALGGLAQHKIIHHNHQRANHRDKNGGQHIHFWI